MNIKEFKKLCVGDVACIPHLKPFPANLRVVRGTENNASDGSYDPYVTTMSHRIVFPEQIDSVVSWKEDGREMDPPWSKLVTVGDPLFESEDKHEIS